MKKLLTREYWHNIFEFSLVIKAFNGVWETIVGLLFLVVNKGVLHSWFSHVAQNELLENPHDQFIPFIAQTFQSVSSDTKTFAALYVLFHGILNIFLAVQLYRNKRWAYLVTISLMIIFVCYQIHRISIHHSLFLTAITIFDVCFILLTWHEYKHYKEKIPV